MTPSDLKSWRTERGLKSEELAALLGVSRAAVSRWENGRHAIPLSVALALPTIDANLKRIEWNKEQLRKLGDATD